MPKTTKFLLIGAAAAALAGCSTINYGPYEKISITSSPAQAHCKIYREGQGYVKAVATPDETYIMRDEGEITITCSKPGYKTTTITTPTVRGIQENVSNVSNLGAGFLVDLANNTQDQLPESIHIDLPVE